jgi:dephospho-CoA kinase
MLIIAITAEKESGKTTVCKKLQELFERDTQKVAICSFAGPLKRLAKSLGWNGEKDEKGRTILQRLGTDVCRNIDDQYWLKRMQEQLNQANLESVDVVLIDDLRFLNEYAFLQNIGALPFKLIRKKTFRQWLKSLFTPKHISEKQIAKMPTENIIKNDGTLEQLLSKIENEIYPRIIKNAQVCAKAEEKEMTCTSKA